MTSSAVAVDAPRPSSSTVEDKENDGIAALSNAAPAPESSVKAVDTADAAAAAMMDLSSAGTSSTPSRNAPPHNSLSSMPPAPPPTWDLLVRQGSRLKTLLADALSHVGNHALETTSRSQKKRSSPDDDEQERPSQRRRPNDEQHRPSTSVFTNLLQEKATEVLRLQRLLRDSQLEASVLQATNTSLREQVASTQTQLTKATLALQASSQQAAQARADAEAAEATAQTLAQTLQSLQTVVDETKKATYLLHQEQEQLSQASTALQSQLLHQESELVRSQTTIQSLRAAKVDWEAQASTYQHDKTELERRYQLTHQALEDLRQQNLERDALEHARKQRAHKIELDLRQTQLLLQEATAGQKASAETQATLQESIQILQAANQSLHEQLTAHQDASRQESVRWNDILTKAARQSQQLRIQNEAADEDLERLQLDKAGVEQQNAQLKVQVGRLEAQLKEATSAAALTVTANNETSASAGGGLVSPTEAEQPSSLGGSSFSLPPLQSSADASTTKSADSTCCVCSKKSFGLMKTCPCGQPECPKRAHVLCAASRPAPISVSHPGTPAPVLPLVLCGAASCWKTPMATTSSSSDTEPATTE